MEHPFKEGNAYFFRTVTYHCIGRVTQSVGKFLLLTEAAWIADSGRFMQTIRDGILNEIELVDTLILNLDSTVDAFPWNHPLPREQK